MVLSWLRGKRTVYTNYSPNEIVRRMHTSIENLNKFLNEYYRHSNPLQRLPGMRRVLKELRRLKIYESKLNIALIKDIESNIGRVTSQFNNNLATPEVIDGAYGEICNSANEIKEDSKHDILKLNYVISWSGQVANRAKSWGNKVKSRNNKKIDQIRKDQERKINQDKKKK